MRQTRSRANLERVVMSADWTSFADAERVLGLANDPRPAWLWSGNGTKLVWHNHAATLFGAKLKSSGLKRADNPQPVRGQASRILRLGLTGRPLLSRVQFLAGRKPLSATCTCTPLDFGGERPHLLVVGVDPIDPKILELDPIAQAEKPDETPEADAKIESAQVDDATARPVVPQATEAEAQAVSDDVEPVEPEDAEDAVDTHTVTAPSALDSRGLSSLIDRLAEGSNLYAPLTEADDVGLLEPAVKPDTHVPPRDYAAIANDEAIEGEHAERGSDWPGEDEPEDEEAAFAADIASDEYTGSARLWQVTGRGLTSSTANQDHATPEDAPRPDDYAVEQSSRYNFEELSRILADRIGQPLAEDSTPEPKRPVHSGGSLVPLSDETLVLNRLPLGILIFRDQDILFANRALVDLTGYENATTLRALGLATVFPQVEGDDALGPVSQLLHRDGTKVPVTARLQSISWQGRSAFMLSARAQDQSDPLKEGEVRRFAALAARTAGQVFFEADAKGILTRIVLSGQRTMPVGISAGQPLTALVAAKDRMALNLFFDQGAKFSETERPAIALDGSHAGQTVTIFAEGRAGIASGYFGVIDETTPKAVSTTQPSTVPTVSLARISQELRRPLNTISGFSELIATEAFGPIDNPRYLEYARDIRVAGSAISALTDELDDLVRLTEGQMTLSPDDIDLFDLLNGCLVRVRGAAGTARVLLRSAISERLPRIKADRPTLQQAVLNMLASAINQAGEGAKVVLSAQRETDGAVTIHIRDSAKTPGALADQFVVFRDGLDKDGTVRQPAVSSIGLTLTRSLAAVNACFLSLDPAADSGTLMALTIPATLVVDVN